MSHLPVNERFLKHVLKTESCWIWTACCFENGYGCFNFRNKNWKASRVAYTLFKEEILGGLFVMHSCDNKKCVNPNHLFTGTAKDNMQDYIRKGLRKLPTHCPKGHEYTHENTRRRKQKDRINYRECKKCCNAADLIRSQGGLRMKKYRDKKL
jgi:hypothetical protein